MNENLHIMIKKYGNKHTIDNFKGRTPYIERPLSDNGNAESGRNSKDVTPSSNKSKNGTSKVDDFSSAVI